MTISGEFFCSLFIIYYLLFIIIYYLLLFINENVEQYKFLCTDKRNHCKETLQLSKKQFDS